MTTFVLYVLACIGVHRIWNFESIFSGVRSRLLARHNRWASWSPYKMVLCHACNAFWICLLMALILRFAPSPAMTLIESTFAGYAVVRAALWAQQAAPSKLVFPASEPSQPIGSPPTPPAKNGRRRLTPEEAAATARKIAAVQPPLTHAMEVKDCAPCSAKKRALVVKQNEYSSFEKRIVLLTSLASFHPSYSLVSVIFDQARMLAANEKWLVQIWINEGTDLKDLPSLPANVQVLAIVPRVTWKLDIVDPVDRDVLSSTVRKHLMQLGNATIISHDMLFISHYLTFAAAIHDIGQTKAFTWLHVCHSAAEKSPRLPDDDRKYRYTVPDGHTLLCLDPGERENLAAHYHTTIDRVVVAPNARDVTTFGAFDPAAATLVQKHRLAEADVVQTYPVSSTRLGAKGVDTVAKVLGKIARNHQRTVRLVLANAHANGQREKRELAAFRARCGAYGLPPEALVISSEEFPQTSADGLSGAAVRDLFSVSNLFIFPSISELSSLVQREAALSGCLMVTNSNLHTGPAELATPALTFPFGSVRSGESQADLDTVASSIVKALDSSPTNVTKRFALKRYCHRTVGSELAAIILSAKPI